MSTPEASSYPYGHIVHDVLISTMRAQCCLLEAHFGGEDIKDERFADEVNKHFSWLALLYKDGINRHFFDAPEGLAPLKTQGLRERRNIPSEILERLKRREAPDAGMNAKEFDLLLANGKKVKPRYWQEGGTRISELIRRAVEADIRESDIRAEKARKSGRKDEEFGFSIRSPLAIVYDLLTAPDLPGSRAYALMAVRNLLFAELELVPDLHADESEAKKPAHRSFGVHDIEEALSLTWTYVRPRYESQGADKIKVGKADPVALVRHFMAVRGIFRFRFGTVKGRSNCLEYLRHGRLRGCDDIQRMRAKGVELTFELERSEYNERLPEAGELVNELLGLPLPIRGGDTVFRGGLGFAARKGLVIAVHGGPGRNVSMRLRHRSALI